MTAVNACAGMRAGESGESPFFRNSDSSRLLSLLQFWGLTPCGLVPLFQPSEVLPMCTTTCDAVSSALTAERTFPERTVAFPPRLNLRIMRGWIQAPHSRPPSLTSPGGALPPRAPDKGKRSDYEGQIRRAGCACTLTCKSGPCGCKRQSPGQN